MASLGLFNSNLTLLHRASFQSRVRSGDGTDLTVFKLSEAEFEGLNWTEKGREFRWDEKMFDVASIEKINDDYIITCKHDVVESFVVNALSYLKKGTAKDLPIKKRSRKSFSTKHFAQDILTPPPVKVTQGVERITSSQKLLVFFDEVESPPPEQLQFS